MLAYKGLEVPPIHNLRRLAEGGGIVTTLSQEDLKRLDFLSQYYLNARYKEDLQELSRQVGGEMAREFVNFAREKIRWLTQEMTR